MNWWLVVPALAYAVYALPSVVRDIYNARRAQSYKAPKDSKWRGKRFFIIVNPFGGYKRGKFIYEKLVVPMFLKAGIVHDVVFTNYPDHIRDLGKSLDVNKYDAVILISGDGSFHELLNSVASQFPQPKEATTQQPSQAHLDHLKRVFDNLAISILPGGSSNGLCSVFGTHCEYETVIKMIEGTAKPFDLLSVNIGASSSSNSGLFFDPMSVSWGFVSVVDQLVEKELRWCWLLGPIGSFIKTTLVPLYVVVRGGSYKGTLSFRPADPPKELAGSYEDVEALSEPDPERGAGWRRVLNRDFRVFVAGNTKHIAREAMTTPTNTSDSGSVDILLVPGNVGALTLAWYLLQTETGSHINSDDCWMLKAKEFVLTPEDPNQSPIDISGDLKTPATATHVVCHPGLMRFIH